VSNIDYAKFLDAVAKMTKERLLSRREAGRLVAQTLALGFDNLTKGPGTEEPIPVKE